MNVDYEEELDNINKKWIIEKCKKDILTDPNGVKSDFAKYASQSTYFYIKYNVQCNHGREQTIKMFNRHFDKSKDHIMPELGKFLVAFCIYEQIHDLTSLRIKQISPENRFQDLIRKLEEIDEKAKKTAKDFADEWITENNPQNWADEYV